MSVNFQSRSQSRILIADPPKSGTGCLYLYLFNNLDASFQYAKVAVIAVGFLSKSASSCIFFFSSKNWPVVEVQCSLHLLTAH